VTGLRALIESLRIHQWSKNLLLAVPALLGQVATQPGVIGALLIAYTAFCLAASGNYILNDLIDLEADRRHPGKRQRPLAAGRMSVRTAAIAGPALITAGVGIAVIASTPMFALMLILYLVIALAYSKIFKRMLVLDAMVLAGLYTLRLLAGGAAVAVAVSSWLLAFSMFLFVSLAFAKRLTELDIALSLNETKSWSRAYVARDREAFTVMGPAAGMLSILVLALYVSSDVIRAHYLRPDLLWLLCPLMLYWVLRVWFVTLRGQLHHDPVVFALRDVASYAVIAGVLAVLLLASR
jgi:4-hydroxybenzoate polyprenyltransferase